MKMCPCGRDYGCHHRQQVTSKKPESTKDVLSRILRRTDQPVGKVIR